ncbi:hypothetical protein GFS31_33200 [Leptolyngbya sp. BL0902]|uniref:hypothetical protein n=1 Tax=Leptolyngbya sp. BL0902 TaxID=1115757 RepID=UPI0018E78D7C|nr:hypothetical protein [Leptolyngbya sp. BL0902]QQE66620.1 hypothetical protein GFS31_33200 [Leptolyngbya sp. BL0902]
METAPGATQPGQTSQDRIASVQSATLTGFIAGLAGAGLLLLHRVAALGWAAAAASTIDGLAGLTFWISVAIAALSGALFGITYRYAVRQDTSSYLRSGVIFAFSFVRGLALVNVGAAVSMMGWPFLIAITESLLMFAVAAAVLELALRRGWVATVPGRMEAEK